MTIYIIGVGPGDERYLTDYARDLILDAGAVVTTEKLSEQLWHLNPNTVVTKIDELADIVLDMLDEQSNICVLVSGDAGFFSISEMLTTAFTEAEAEFECVSGLSYLQYLANALGVSYDSVVAVNADDARGGITPYVCYNRKVFVAVGEDCGVHKLIEQLAEARLTKVKVSVGENLGAETERIITDTPQALLKHQFDDAAVMLVENAEAVDYMAVIDDTEYAGAAVLKQCARRLALAELKITPEDIVADVGAGNGAAAVEAARLAHRGQVFAIEKNETAANNAKRNINRFGAYNVTLINAENTPVGVKKLPKIYKALVDGAAGNLSEIMHLLMQNNQDMRLVVSAYDLTTLYDALQVLDSHKLTSSVMCVNISVSERGDVRNLMYAQNPVYLITAF